MSFAYSCCCAGLLVMNDPQHKTERTIYYKYSEVLTFVFDSVPTAVEAALQSSQGTSPRRGSLLTCEWWQANRLPNRGGSDYLRTTTCPAGQVAKCRRRTCLFGAGVNVHPDWLCAFPTVLVLAMTVSLSQKNWGCKSSVGCCIIESLLPPYYASASPVLCILFVCVLFEINTSVLRPLRMTE